jgi:predicted acyl esterase
VATYAFPVSEDLVLMGGPVVDFGFATTGPDTQLHVRMWDVTSDGSAQGLVTRGTYRSLDAPGTARHARFQLDPQGYRFPAGHQLKVEVTANDAPFFQASNVPAIVTVERLQVTLPLHVSPTADAGARQPRSGPVATSPASPAQLPATGTSMTALAALATLGLALGFRRLSRIRH